MEYSIAWPTFPSFSAFEERIQVLEISTCFKQTPLELHGLLMDIRKYKNESLTDRPIVSCLTSKIQSPTLDCTHNSFTIPYQNFTRMKIVSPVLGKKVSPGLQSEITQAYKIWPFLCTSDKTYQS